MEQRAQAVSRLQVLSPCSFSYTCTRCLLFASVLNQDTKMLAACKHENPHLRSLRQDVQLKCLNTLSLLGGETCIREGWLTAV